MLLNLKVSCAHTAYPYWHAKHATLNAEATDLATNCSWIKYLTPSPMQEVLLTQMHKYQRN